MKTPFEIFALDHGDDIVFALDRQIRSLENKFDIGCDQLSYLLTEDQHRLLSAFLFTVSDESSKRAPLILQEYLKLQEQTAKSDPDDGPGHPGGFVALTYNGLWFLGLHGGMGYPPYILAVVKGTENEVLDLVASIAKYPDTSISPWVRCEDGNCVRTGFKGHYAYWEILTVFPYKTGWYWKVTPSLRRLCPGDDIFDDNAGELVWEISCPYSKGMQALSIEEAKDQADQWMLKLGWTLL